MCNLNRRNAKPYFLFRSYIRFPPVCVIKGYAKNALKLRRYRFFFSPLHYVLDFFVRAKLTEEWNFISTSNNIWAKDTEKSKYAVNH